jgi:hypothetical protein
MILLEVNMKRRAFLAAALAVLALGFLPAQAAKKKITVSNVAQLLRAIAPNVEITLKPGTYDLESGQKTSGKYYAWRAAGSGKELAIKGVKNFALKGEDTEAASNLRTSNPSAFVLRFEDSSEVDVSAVNMSHQTAGPCDAGVVGFSGCVNVSMRDCLLSGSGSLGIVCEDSSELLFEGLTVSDCSLGALSFRSGGPAHFSACLFTRNASYPLIEAQGGEGIVFSSCEFTENSGDVLVSARSPEGDPVSFYSCVFEANQVDQWSAEEPSPIAEECAFRDNAFNAPMPDGEASADGDAEEEGMDDGLTGSMPAYYIHWDSGLAFLYPPDWTLDEYDEYFSLSSPDGGEAVGCFFIDSGAIPKNANLKTGADKAFAAAFEQYKKNVKGLFDYDVDAAADGPSLNLDYIPCRDYSGSIDADGVPWAARFRVFSGEGRYWVLCLFADDMDLIGEGSDADLIMQTVDFAPRGE